MKSDKSRETFDAKKHYSSVRLQQGRVLTDADWNEQSDIIEHRDETTSTDVIGQAGVPVGADGFHIGDNGDGNLTISAGRMYVDGILSELESATTYFDQPDAPFSADLGGVQPVPFGRVLAFLDVWQRHIGIVEDPFIREVALGGPDTASRAKTTWQVKLRGFDPETTSVDALLASLAPGTQQGKLAARAEPSDAPTDPCTIPQAAGFRSLENQLYRVEVHTSGQLIADGAGGAGANGAASIAPTFKWSRDNGSVVAEWIEDAEGIPGTIRVKLLTTDETRGFAKGQWIELLDDRRELSDTDISGLHTGFIQSGLGGVFVRIDHVEADRLFLDTTTVQDPLAGFGITDPLAFPGPEFHPKVRRWDMPFDSGGPQPIDRAGAEGWIDLENGVQVQFQEGFYNVGDYWLIPARTASGGIEWPPLSPSDDSPAPLPPRGITHHVACLATFDAAGTEVVFEFGPFADCRKRFHPLTDITPAPAIDQPKPDEYRYYLIDGSQGTGDDSAGLPGVAMTPGAAYSNAIPFFTVNAALAKFPRDGNGSFAIFMLQGSATSGTNYGDFILNGVHGYRKVLIRGSNFAGGGTKADPIPIDDWDSLGGSSVLGRSFTLDPQAPTPFGSNVLNLDRQAALTDGADTLVGSRVRFEDTSSLGNFSTMVLGNVPGGGNHPGGQITTGTAFFSVPGGTDRFSLEQPAVFLNDVFIGINATDSASPPSEEGPVTSSGLAVVGLNMTSLDLRGTFYGEIAFCQANFVRLSRFVQLKINGTYTDERSDGEDGSHTTGVGVNVTNSLIVSDGDDLLLSNSVASGAVIQKVDSLSVPQGYFSAQTVIDTCDRFSIGTPLQVPSSSKLVRIGAGATQGATLRISHSDGEVLGTAFDMENLHQNFRFNADDGVNQAAIRFEGTGHSLRLRDVDLTHGQNNTPSGVLLDATGAVASNFDYDQRGMFGASNPDLAAVVVSGLVALPGRSMFRPWELSYTDFRDPADNHYFSPDVSTKSFQAGMNTIAAGQGRTFVQRGLAAQGITNIVNAGNVGITRYRVVQFVGDGTARVRMARADLKDFETGVTATAEVIAASIAGVSQHGVIQLIGTDPSEEKKQFTTVVSTGYSLVSLNGLPSAGVRLPVPVYLSSNWGTVSTVRPTETSLAVILIGSLLRVVAQNDLGDAGSGDAAVGLVRLNIQLAPPPSAPVVIP